MDDILICEDDEPIRGLLLRVVEREGYSAQIATNGDEALRCIEQGDYRAILLDMMMPKITGFDIVERLRLSRPAVLSRIIVVTASLPAMKSPPVGIGGFFMKPFDLNKLVEAIHGLVKKEH
ncbi:MAG TPA: response regulator [Thermoanaerobaculia bacterium]|nr:response regulator [Thermoanaerobaculia bacterium]